MLTGPDNSVVCDQHPRRNCGTTILFRRCWILWIGLMPIPVSNGTTISHTHKVVGTTPDQIAKDSPFSPRAAACPEPRRWACRHKWRESLRRCPDFPMEGRAREPVSLVVEDAKSFTPESPISCPFVYFVGPSAPPCLPSLRWLNLSLP